MGGDHIVHIVPVCRGRGLLHYFYPSINSEAEWFWTWVLFSKFPAPAGEFTLRRSLDNRPRVRLRALRLALLVLLTFVLCWTPYYLLGLWYWFSPTMLTEVPPSLSHILFLFGLLNAPLDPLLYGAFTLGCRRRHQELSSDSSREGGSGRMHQQESQALRQMEVKTNAAARKAGETKETFLWHPFALGHSI